MAARSPAWVIAGPLVSLAPAFARALAPAPQVLLCDEPTGALDSDNSRQLFGLMRELCDERGRGVVLATHDPLAQRYADSTYLMVDGVVAPR